ncbi:hypothetical protein [Streptoalloteichus hindustanus]|uniref:hypothetical protein n=1 Tax=Streptoalloteichus hindustanus TaxID=2017 RepID=UPI0009358967|nr:hypothetical protein [Streptoalloteichus hindustanus]
MDADNADKPRRRGGRRLRTAQQMREAGCSDAVITLVKRLQHLLHQRFGVEGPLRALVKHALAHRITSDAIYLPQHTGAETSAKDVSRLVSRLSEQMGGQRSTQGPAWPYAELIVRCCSPDPDAELAHVASLWAAARGGARPPGYHGPLRLPASDPPLALPEDHTLAELTLRCSILEHDLAKALAENTALRAENAHLRARDIDTMLLLNSTIRAFRRMSQQRDRAIASRATILSSRDRQAEAALADVVREAARRKRILRRQREALTKYVAMHLASSRVVEDRGVATVPRDPVHDTVTRVLGDDLDGLGFPLEPIMRHLRHVSATASLLHRTIAIYLWLRFYYVDSHTDYERLARKIGYTRNQVVRVLTATDPMPVPVITAVTETLSADKLWINRLLSDVGAQVLVAPPSPSHALWVAPERTGEAGAAAHNLSGDTDESGRG